MSVDLTIIIANWNSGNHLRNCLLSIQEHGKDWVRQTVVVDNGSTDNSLSGIDNLIIPINVIRNTENKGFAAACNQGAVLANSEYLLFLNTDTLLFENSLSVPLAFMQRPENAKVGICGIQLIDETGQVSRSCSRFPSVRMFVANALGVSKLPKLRSWNHQMVEWDHATTRQVDHVIGAFYLIRRSLFEALKGFDDRFFVYLEDLDLSLRAHKAGWKSVFIADAQAFHAGGGTSRQVKAARLFYSLRSRLLYGFKHFSAWRAWALMVVTMCIEPVTRTAFSLLNRDWSSICNTQKAYSMLVANIITILQRHYQKKQT